MPISLRIDAETVDEFDTLLARFTPSQHGYVAGPIAEHIMPEIAATTETPKKSRGKKIETAAEPTQLPDGTVIPPTPESVPQPTPGGTSAPPAEAPITPAVQQPPKQEAEGNVSTPAAASTAPASTDTAGGEVTLPMLKDAMSAGLKRGNAGGLLEALVAATGCRSLTTGSPNVMEKAGEDPSILRTTLDALNAYNAG